MRSHHKDVEGQIVHEVKERKGLRARFSGDAGVFRFSKSQSIDEPSANRFISFIQETRLECCDVKMVGQVNCMQPVTGQEYSDGFQRFGFDFTMQQGWI